MTQQELAQQVGCSVATIVKIEADERRPSRQVAELLAQHLEIPFEQRGQFLKIARKEKSLDTLGEITDTGPASRQHKAQIIQPPGFFIGREYELAQIAGLMQNPKCHLLTLTGAGGIGKTRLALEAAWQQQDAFEHGGIFINLAPLTGRDQIVTAIADALGIVLYTASDRSVQLVAHLQQKGLLLVLDNFEHLLGETDCVALPGDLLKGAPRVKLLVTSREPLQLQSEWVFEVRGLPVPGMNDGDQPETSSATKLFVQRARQARANFEVTPEDYPAVRQICQLVDGVPLAIELAAAWIGTLTCAEIAHEIQANVNFLTTSARDVTERHRSLRATFDYSWRLLSQQEQTVLRQLSIFKGGFTREAAEYVAGANLPLLAALVSKSLLRRTDSGHYDMHELVRQFLLETLTKNGSEYAATCDRHADYYALLLHRRGEGFKGVDQFTVATELAAEIANLRQAWRWAGERGQAIQVGQAADTLFWLYESRCDCREGVPLFGYVAERLESDEADEMRAVTRARVMSYQGFFRLRQGQHPQAKDVLQESLAILRPYAEAGSTTARDGLAYTLAFLGMVTAALGDYASGSRYLHEGLEIKRADKDRWGITFCLHQLGLLAYYQGNYEEAHRLLSESLDVSRAIGNDWATAYSLDFLSTAAYARGAYAEAERYLHEGLALSKSVGDRFTAAYALNGLGLVRKALGDYTEARQQLESSITIWREIGDQASLAQSLNILGEVLLESGERETAQKCFLEALAVARSASLTPIMLDALLGNASLQAKARQHDSAFKILVHIKDHPSGTSVMKSRAEEMYSTLLQSCEGQLDSMQTEPGFESFEHLVDEVLAG